jgi:hypothetical protein
MFLVDNFYVKTNGLFLLWSLGLHVKWEERLIIEHMLLSGYAGSSAFESFLAIIEYLCLAENIKGLFEIAFQRPKNIFSIQKVR